MTLDISILFEDTELLVCEKPSGVPVQSGDLRTKDMESLLKNHLARQNKSGEPYLGLIHRLDQPVQGVLVFAKTKRAAAGLSRQIQEGRFLKYYQAVVCGKPEEERGVFVDYLRKDGKSNTSSVAARDSRDAKRAELSYCLLQEAAPYSLIEIELKTGRHHQIRVQMAAHGMPLFGDRKYHPQPETGEEAGGIGLCACRLEFTHPVSGKKMSFSCRPESECFKLFYRDTGEHPA